MRLLLTVVGALLLSPAAQAVCTPKISRLAGAAPLRVRFVATCPSSSYHWIFGDGSTATGRTAVHSYPGGRFTPSLTTDTGRAPLPPITSVHLAITAPPSADYGSSVTLHATVTPDLPVRVGGRAFRHGSLTLAVTHPFLTAVAGPAAVHLTITVRPVLDLQLLGTPTLGATLVPRAVLRPAHAGTVRILVDGTAAPTIDTSNIGTVKVAAISDPARGWAAVARVLRVRVRAPTLAVGASGPAVVALEKRLRALSYALPDTRGLFDSDTQQAVYAFQDVNGLTPTGVVTPSLWGRLASAQVPTPRYGGDHIEVNKTRQVLYVVRHGKVTLITHVSTGATGNTPLGLWHVYAKVAGWSWVLWYPSYFLRGFAIHGYPEVPPYPASHGCVRIPMWLAPRLFPQAPVGSAIYIYA